MKCYNCGYESPDDFSFCSECGAAQSTANQSGAASEVTYTSPYNAGTSNNTPQVPGVRVLTALKDSLFLILCIVYSAGTLFSLINGDFSVIGILMTIFLWLTYANAQKGVASRENLRCISGTVFASYVINYVIAGSVAFVGLVVMIFGTGGSGFLADIIRFVFKEAGFGFHDGFMSRFIAGAAMIFGAVLIIGAAIVAVINYFSTRSIHLFVQSVYRNDGGVQIGISNANTARIWLMVLGILEAVGAVSALFGKDAMQFIASGAGAAAKIIGSIMIEKYYNETNR